MKKTSSQKIIDGQSILYKKRWNWLLKILGLWLFSLGCYPQQGKTQGAFTMESIHHIQKHCNSKKPITAKSILYKESYHLRFNELGEVYNPTFPKTRNKVSVRTYQASGKVLEEISYSISTHRATVLQKGRVGVFYLIMRGKKCNSMIAYEAKKEGDYLVVTGELYKCFSAP